MQIPLQLSLLRRTSAALGAAIALLGFDLAHAQGTVTLSGASGNSCSYSAMSVAPNGSVVVTCSGGGNPNPNPDPVDPAIPGTFVMAASTMSVPANTNASVAVTRTLGSLATTLYYWTSGDGCDGYTGALGFGSGQMSNALSVPVKAAGSTCTVTLAGGAPVVLGNPSATAITVIAGSNPGPGPGPTVPPGCPAAPAEMLSASFAGPGNPLLQMQKSGQIVAITLPNMNGRATGQVTFGESAGGAYTPQPVTLEISINRCPGVIDTDYSNQCNLRNTNGNYNSITWLTKPYSVITDARTASAYGMCWAADGGYINARWSYQSCAFGVQTCGFAIQYNDGPY